MASGPLLSPIDEFLGLPPSQKSKGYLLLHLRKLTQPDDLPARLDGLLGVHLWISLPVSSCFGAAGSVGQLSAASRALTGTHLASCQS